jgi:NAD(P)H-dependent flavin oxidoreductase YrpB (nitropropane dioxygenase family)
MKTKLCERLGLEFPLFAFSHCRDVVAEVSNAGGFGVLGVVALSPEELERELSWIDERVHGRPYGIDLLMPTSMDSKDRTPSVEELEAKIPPAHRQFVEQLLQRHGIDTSDLWIDAFRPGHADSMREVGASRLLDTAFSHPLVRMVVSALGIPPPFMLQKARAANAVVGALAGARSHALKHAEAGVDVVIAAGTEAGGHCGEVSTMVLVPEILRALRRHSSVDVLAAGGIVTGRQMAACMAMGAAGVWTGSVWLTTPEAETVPVVKEKMLGAESRDTVRSRSRTGKFTRQLRSAWTDAWLDPASPTALPTPLQGVLAGAAFRKINKLAAAGHPGAVQLASYYVGQGVGLMDQPMSVRSVVQEFMADFASAADRLTALVEH